MSAALEYHRTGKTPCYTAGFEIVVGPPPSDIDDIMAIVGGDISLDGIEDDDLDLSFVPVKPVPVFAPIKRTADIDKIESSIIEEKNGSSDVVDVNAFIDNVEVDLNAYLVDESTP